MAVNLNTGAFVSTQQVGNAPQLYDDITPTELVVYPNTATPYMNVPQGMMLVLTAYNADTLMRGRVYKVLRSAGASERMVGGTACCPQTVRGESVELGSAYLPCYDLTKDNAVVVIRIPGTYTLRVERGDGVTVTTGLHPMQPTDLFMCKGVNNAP